VDGVVPVQTTLGQIAPIIPRGAGCEPLSIIRQNQNDKNLSIFIAVHRKTTCPIRDKSRRDQ
jgi:hypothetical protein